MNDNCRDMDTTSSDLRDKEHRKITRTETAAFNIRTDCFICGENEKRTKQKRENLTAVSKNPKDDKNEKSMRDRVMNIAKEINDNNVYLRMLNYSDLFAFDAKYNRS